MQDRALLTPAKLDALADQGAAAQKLYQAGLAAALAEAFQGRMFARSDLQAATVDLYMSANAVFVPQVHDNTGTVYMNARRFAGDSRLDKSTSDQLDYLTLESISEVLNDVWGALNRDRSAVTKAFNRYEIERFLTQGRATLAGRISNLKFSTPDRTGKLWQSTVMVRTALRQHYLLTQIETALFIWSRRGVDRVKAVWTSDGKPFELAFSITGKTQGMPTYLEIKDGVFHPNSTATVEQA